MSERASNAARPNLLLITTDQQRYDTIRPHAPPFLRTPHLDLLRYEGITFDRAYAETPICVPTRVSLLTGRSAFDHGMTHNGSTSDVVDRDATLPARLRAAGYGTAAIGKLHFTPQRARHGFDETRLPEDYYRWIRESGSPLQPMRHGIGQNELYPVLATVPEALTLTSWIAEQCVRFIRDERDPTVPFFLWASFSKPHPPLDPPEPYASMYRDCDPPAPITSSWSSGSGSGSGSGTPAAFARQRERGAFDELPDGVVEDARRAYYGLVTHVDHAIGRVFSALQDLDLLGDTTIVLTSDHGEFLGDHGTGNKVMWHEPSARVPMIVRPAPSLGLDVAGTTCDALVTHSDVTATLLAQGGVEPPGPDLIDVSRGESGRREYLYGLATERPRGGVEPLVYLAATDGRWKYVWYPEGPSEQLFDLVTDPDETRDLARDTEASSHRERLADALLEHVRSTAPRWTPDGRLPRVPTRGDSTRERRTQSWPGFHTEHYDGDVRH